MVWEQEVTTIVMLTKLVEDAKVNSFLYGVYWYIMFPLQIKCHQYWPNKGFVMFGDIKVTLQKEERLANYCIRQLSIEKVLALCYTVNFDRSKLDN